MRTARIRLYVDQPLGPEQSVPLSREQAHYLRHVMRRAVGDHVRIFDGRTGEWDAEIGRVERGGGALRCIAQTAPQQDPPDLWLLFAPIKKARTDFIVEKATELGAARICPVVTAHTNVDRLRRDRLQAHAVEAAEQCGGTYVPPVEELQPLSRRLADWPADRQLMFCDEAQAGPPARQAGGFGPGAGGPWAILVGPEGGFSPEERDRLGAMAQTHVVSLGPRILRADTAVVAATTLWQWHRGDWR